MKIAGASFRTDQCCSSPDGSLAKSLPPRPACIDESTLSAVPVNADGPPPAPSRGVLVTVIVCTHNRAGLLEGCLRSLVDQTMPVDQYEVIIVQNACTDHTTSVSEEFSQAYRNVRSLREPQPGKSRAANTGLGQARGTYVAFIDDDARAPRAWVEQISRAFSNATPSPAVVLGRVTSVYETAPPDWWEPVTRQRTRDRGFWEPGLDRYRVAGSNFAFNREALIECGGFAVDRGPVGDLYRVGEDMEAAFRVAARYPYVWYDPAIVVEHWVPIEKMSFRYLIWRAHLSGVAISEIERLGLFSSLIPALLTWLAVFLAAKAWRRRDAPRLKVFLMRLALRFAMIAGMVRGARILR